MWKYLQITLMIFAMLFMRPCLLAEEYALISIPIICLALLVKIFTRNRVAIIFDKSHVIIMSSVILLWLFLLLGSVINQVYHVDYAIKAFSAHVFIVLIFGYLLSEKEINKLFFRSFVWLLAFFGFSSLISIILISLIGVSDIVLFEVLEYRILFPFSLEYNTIYIFHRFMMIFREPGIAQAFLCWAFVYALYYKESRWLILGIIIGIVLTFSTIAILCFLSVLLLLYLLNQKQSLITRIKRVFLSSAFIYAFYLVVYYIPVVGIEAKLQTHTVSVTDRESNMMRAIENMSLFGDGLYSASKYNNAAINLIAMSDKIGVIVFVLVLGLYYLPIFIRKQNNFYYFIAITPIVITSLFAQPILDAPLVYLFLFTYFLKHEKTNISYRIK